MKLNEIAPSHTTSYFRRELRMSLDMQKQRFLARVEKSAVQKYFHRAECQARRSSLARESADWHHFKFIQQHAAAFRIHGKDIDLSKLSGVFVAAAAALLVALIFLLAEVVHSYRIPFLFWNIFRTYFGHF